MKRSNVSLKWLVGLAVVLLGLLSLWLIFPLIQKKEENKQPEPEPEPEPTEEDDRLNIAKHYSIIKAQAEAAGYNDTIARLVTAQALHESSDADTGAPFDSEIYHANNNMFGMMQPHVRDTTSIGEKNGYASYVDIDDSAKDYFLWAKYVGMPDTLITIDDFNGFLKSKDYYTDNVITYKNGIKRHLSIVNNIINAG